MVQPEFNLFDSEVHVLVIMLHDFTENSICTLNWIILNIFQINFKALYYAI